MYTGQEFDILTYFVVFILGLIFGSFFNVCIYRIPRNESIVFQRSHCVRCGYNLKPSDMLPVFSFLIHKGKCRYCNEKISFIYPIVELITAFTFIILFFKFGFSIQCIAFLFLISVLIIVFFIDLKWYIIPDGLVITAIIGGVLVFLYNIFYDFPIFLDRVWWDPLVGSLVGSGFLLIVAIIGNVVYKTEDAIGMGDVKIFFPIGLFLGWKMTIIALVLSIFLAGGVSVILIAARIRDRKGQIPFGPFICVGSVLTLLFGADILNYYFSSF